MEAAWPPGPQGKSVPALGQAPPPAAEADSALRAGAVSTEPVALEQEQVEQIERAPTLRHQYQTRLLRFLEQVWSEIDKSDWTISPPKKVSIETDLTKRFGLTNREAGMIATMFVPDNRRGKAKKG